VSKPTHVLTARSISGKRVDLITGSPSTSVSVYARADLGARLAAYYGREDPDLEVTVRELAEDER
jgi:hypothetical protein